ncbi:MAG: tRNA lysidine(34) synthetase TilS [Pseudomonadota bacterium]
MVVPDDVRAALATLPGPVGIACSGGGDSLGLLHIAYEVRRDLTVLTVDHGLRREAAQEAEMVAALCDRLRLSHTILPLGLSDGPALMARARTARYDAMTAWARKHGVSTICLGHTQDDVAETLLMRLSDGVGLDGLAQMADRFQRGGITFLRPLLATARRDLRARVVAAGWSPVDDPTNDDARFDRARIRKGIATLGLDSRAIARSAATLRKAQEALDWQVARIAAEIAQLDRGDWLIERDALAALPLEIVRRLLLGGLAWIGGGLHPPRYEEQRTFLDRARAGQAATLQGVQLRAEGTRLRLSREPAAAARAPEQPVGAVWDTRWCVTGPQGTVRALGEGIADIIDWRAAGLPRSSLIAGPAVWDGHTLLGTPLLPGGPWTATCRDPFARSDTCR